MDETKSINLNYENDIPIYLHIPWDENKNVNCPYCGDITSLNINKHYWRDVKHANVDAPLIYNVEIIDVYCADCDNHFTIRPAGVSKYKRITDKSQNLIINSYTFDDISVQQLEDRLKRDFHLELSSQILQDLINKKIKDIPVTENQGGIKYSGLLCIDGMHGKTNGIEDVTILATDTITGITFEGQIRASESIKDIEEFLTSLKKIIPFDPFLIITDFVEWDAVIKKKFPNTLHQKCHFHLMEHLTNGIKKEVTKHINKLYGVEIKELQEVRRQTLKIEKEENPPKIEFDATSKTAQAAVEVVNNLIEIVQTSPPADREGPVDELIIKLEGWNENGIKNLKQDIIKKKPISPGHY